MTHTYFSQNQWEDFTYQRLNMIIDQFKNQQNAYVVFDFDNTSIFMDIEDNYLIYAIDYLLFYLEPDALYQLLLNGPYDFDTEIQSHLTFKNLAKEIRIAYESLYRHYIKLPETTKSLSLLSNIRKTQAFQEFKTKLYLYYQKANQYFDRQEGKGWMTYHFAGQSRHSFYQNAIAMFPIMEQFPFEQQHYKAHSQSNNISLSCRFDSGLYLPQETRDLYRAFKDNGITVYIISASPIDLVYAANDYYQLDIPKECIIAMEYPVGNGVIQSTVKNHSYITEGPGKSQAIREQIMKIHPRDPVAVFGDSNGDYDMMIDFDDLELAVLFNRLFDDKTQEIVDLAIKQYGNSQARYVLQGRNEQIGRLQKSPKTRPIDSNIDQIKP